MTRKAVSRILHLIRNIAEDQCCQGLPDGELLRRFSSGRDESAFHGLMLRHGSMVLDVCRSVLGNEHDAEEAFQATFLLLAQKGGTIQKTGSVGSWLYGVAYRIALRARAQAARRRKHEATSGTGQRPADASDDLTWCEVKQALYAELNRLSDHYRLPLVLCYLEGKTQDVAARWVGVSKATLKKRLERGRALLRVRLVRRGLGPAAILAVSAWPAAAASASLPPGLGSGTVKAATALAAGHAAGRISAQVAALTEGVPKAMWIKTLKTVAAVFLVLGLITFGGRLLTDQTVAGPQSEVAFQAGEGNKGDPKKPRIDKPAPAQDKAANKLVTKETQQAIDAGLAYLAAQQAADGSWGNGAFRGNLGVTGLAGRAFLAGGFRPGKGKYGANLTRALEYILTQEDKATPGFLHNRQAGGHGPMYGHGFALLFLAEAHGTIADKKLKERVHELLGRAIKLTVDSQNREGGWRYLPRPADADITVTACQLQALRATQNTGVAVQPKVFEQGVEYILGCQDVNGDGGFRYMRQGGPTGFARTAAALESLYQAGKGKSKEAAKGLDYLRAFRPDLKRAAVPAIHYYHGQYYAAQAMWRVGGKDWEKWYPVLRDELLKHPDRQKQQDGETSWNDRAVGAHYGTAMALIVLQIPHEKLPSLKR